MDKYRTATQMDKVLELAEVAPVISALVHEMQKERGGSAVFISSKGAKFVKELPDQVGNANWKKASDNFPINHTVMGQDDLRINFNDAQTYCNWLGKVLPTAEQFEHISMQDNNQKVAKLIEFRCVRNI